MDNVAQHSPVVIAPTGYHLLMPSDAVKDVKHRLRGFREWMQAHERPWYAPDLAAYRDHLLDERGLSPASVQAHLSTIRGQYGVLLVDNTVRDWLWSNAPGSTPADKKALVDESLTRLKNAIDPQTAPIKTVTRQDQPDDAFLRLTKAQADALLSAPGVETLPGLRDTALIALLLCTGVREAELCALNVGDLRSSYGGALALHVRKGKGLKERLVPYGALDWCLVIVEAWLREAGIGTGAVFRGFLRSGRVRSTRLSVRAVQNILDRYPVSKNGQVWQVNPHDLRRTYARRLYDAGVPIIAIQQNLGHASHATTERYIGKLDASSRQPPALYSFDLRQPRSLGR
jgi:site-specific recombinase XerD